MERTKKRHKGTLTKIRSSCRQTLLKIVDHSVLHIFFLVFSSCRNKRTKFIGKLKRRFVYDILDDDLKKFLVKTLLIKFTKNYILRIIKINSKFFPHYKSM